MRPAPWLLALILTALIAGYFGWNDIMGLRAEEPRRAVVALEVYLGDRPLIPQIHGEPYYNKPPLYAWVLAAFFEIADSIEPWVVRLPGVLSIWLTSVLIFLTGQRYLDRNRAIAASLMYLTMGDLIYYGAVNSGEIDLFYSFIVVAQGLAIYHFSARNKMYLLFLVSYAFTAIGVLTKGLPSIAFQGITLLAWMAATSNFKKLFSLAHLAGIAVFAILVGGYFYLYNLEEDAIAFATNLFYESSQKSASGSKTVDILLAILKFPLQFIQITLPWSLILLLAIRRKAGFRSNSLLRFSVVFILANILIYWISPDVRNRYLYMFFPFLAFLTSHLYSQFFSSAVFQKRSSLIFAIITVLAAIFFVSIPFIEKLGGSLDNPFIRSLPFAALLIITGFLSLKLRSQAFYVFILTLALVRIGYNVCILPIQAGDARSSYYSDEMKKVASLTANEEIYWTGSPYYIHPEISLFGTEFFHSEISTPPLVAYQIPYYYTLNTKRRLLYERNPLPGKWYLGERSYAENLGSTIHYSFRDKWMDRELVLYRNP